MTKKQLIESAAIDLCHGAKVMELGLENNPYYIKPELLHDLIDALDHPGLYKD